MSNIQDTNIIPELQSPFEQLREIDADGKEWWNSRKLARVMGYGKYWNFERVSYSFQLEGCNDVKYKVKFAESDNVEETGEFKTMYMFNPVKIDGTWYLTVKRPGQDFDTNM